MLVKLAIPFQGLCEFCHFQLETTGVGLLEMIQGWVNVGGGGGIGRGKGLFYFLITQAVLLTS